MDFADRTVTPKCNCAMQADFQLCLSFVACNIIKLHCVIIKINYIFGTWPVGEGLIVPPSCRLLCSDCITCDWHWLVPGTQFTTGLETHDWNLEKLSLLHIWFSWSNHDINLQMARQLSCRDMCTFFSWLDHSLMSKSTIHVYKIWIMSSWPLCGMGLSASLINGDYNQLAGN